MDWHQPDLWGAEGWGTLDPSRTGNPVREPLNDLAPEAHLCCGIYKNRPDWAHHALERGADPNRLVVFYPVYPGENEYELNGRLGPSEDTCAVALAAGRGAAEMLRELLDHHGGNPNARPSARIRLEEWQAAPPLLEAALNGQAGTAALLLERGAQITGRIERALEEARARHRPGAEEVAVLFARFADRAHEAERALAAAIAAGDAPAVRAALEAGADPDADVTYETDWDEIARREAEANSLTDERDARSWRSADEARFGRKGAFGALHYGATQRGYAEVVAALLEGGANPHRPDPEGRCALNLAAEHGTHEVAELLWRYRADPCVGDSSGLTPLERARLRGDDPMVAMFLERRPLLPDKV